MRATSQNIYTPTMRRVKESLVTERTPRPQMGSAKRRLFENLASDGCTDFYNYLDWLDLAAIKDTLIIPKRNHFFFSKEDFIGKETIINLKCLNKVQELKEYVNTLYNYLPENCYFTACFQESDIFKEEVPDYKKYLAGDSESISIKNNGPSKHSWLSLTLSRLFKSETNNILSRRSIKMILRDAGFTVLDITELNGKTYLCAQKRRVTFN